MRHRCFAYKEDFGWHCSEDPCQCKCRPCIEYRRIQSLPEVTDEEMTKLQEMLQDATPGPWRSTHIEGFGPQMFIVTDSDDSQARWYNVVATMNNVNHIGGELLAWSRDGMPRLIRRIEALKNEIKELRARYDAEDDSKKNM
jgi:hypothetical protein